MPEPPRPSVLFVCIATSCRSQMAEAAARAVAGDRWEIWSAGSSPSGRIHPVAIETMRELGMALEGQRSKGLHEVPQREWDYVVTMGCGDACPTLPAKDRRDWALPDPKNMPLEEFRKVRDEIEDRVKALIQEIRTQTRTGPIHEEDERF